jgi:hypothetical protein
MTRVADRENESLLLDQAKSATGAELEKVCARFRGLDRDKAADELRFVRRRHMADGTVRIEMQLLPDASGQVLDIGRRRRTVSAPLRRALLMQQRCCTFPGCNHSAYVEAHHIEHWADGGETRLENLLLVCHRHHLALHEGGFSVERRDDGTLVFFAPDGRLIEAAPAAAAVDGGGMAAIVDRQRARGLSIGPGTAPPRWRDAPLDLGRAVEVLAAKRDGACARLAARSCGTGITTWVRMTIVDLLASILSPWGVLQFAAVVSGAFAVAWFEGRRWLLPYAVGCCGATLGAVMLGPLLRSPAVLFGGATPEVEVMSYGALAGVVAGFALVAGRRELDRIAIALGPMVAVARLGCFVAGCDYGKLASLPWAVRPSAGQPGFFAQVEQGLLPFDALHAMPVHPTQLYEAALGVGMLLLAWGARRRRPGDAVAITLAAYAAGRFVIEFWRGDPRAMLGPLSLAQLLSVAVLAACLGSIARDVKASSRRRARLSAGDGRRGDEVSTA